MRANYVAGTPPLELARYDSVCNTGAGSETYAPVNANVGRYSAAVVWGLNAEALWNDAPWLEYVRTWADGGREPGHTGLAWCGPDGPTYGHTDYNNSTHLQGAISNGRATHDFGNDLFVALNAPATCGDGTREGSETCDDGGTTPGDGCSALCTVELGWSCGGLTPDVCSEVCGDGSIVGAETCDDGGTTPGDGCSALCQVEAGWSCSGEPSTCSEDAQDPGPFGRTFSRGRRSP